VSGRKSVEAVARAQVAALAELVGPAWELRCQAADFCNEVHTMPLKAGYLRPVSARISDLSTSLARLAVGRMEAHARPVLNLEGADDPDASNAVTGAGALTDTEVVTDTEVAADTEVVSDVKAVTRCQAAALAELATLAETLQRATAELFRAGQTTDPDQLKATSSRVNDLAGALARATRGYREVRVGDKLYAEILADLERRRWQERPGWKLGGTLPPVRVSELGSYRGYLRGWERGLATLQLWFSAPGTLVYATAGIGRQLLSSADVRAVIMSREEAAGYRRPPRTRR
jgi:hypothetical protein